MPRRAPLALLSFALCIPLVSCAAAVVPVAVGGLAARQRLKPGKVVHPSQARPTVAGVPTPASDHAPRPEPIPANPAAMRAGHIYAGALPGRPSETLPAPSTATGAPSPAEVAVDGSGTQPGASRANGWGAALRYVAATVGSHVHDSVLLTRGSSLDSPSWVPCENKPQAVLVDLDAVVPPSGGVPAKVAEALGAMETMDIPLLYTSTRAAPDLAKATARLSAADLHKPRAGETLFPSLEGREPTVRSAASIRYCVIAVIGSRPQDFPNSATPDSAGARWNPGWFMVPAAAS